MARPKRCSAFDPSACNDLAQVLNLGAGVQSTTVLLMSMEGELPPLDHVIFADTGWEPQAVYRHLEWLQTLTTIHVVSQGNIKEDALKFQVAGGNICGTKEEHNGERWASMPMFTQDRETLSNGMIRRQCTSEYKIRPIERFIRRTVLGLAPRQRAPKVPTIRQWYGISLDEHQRMAKNPNKWTVNYYPLIERRMTRQHCLDWLAKRGIAAPRSACIACPFKHNSEWRNLRDGSPDEWRTPSSSTRRFASAAGCGATCSSTRTGCRWISWTCRRTWTGARCCLAGWTSVRECVECKHEATSPL